MSKNNKIQPDNFELEMTSHWSFKNRGKWATHDASWRGNWSPYIPRNVILRYSNVNDVVLDQFLGGGTTAIEARLLNRNFIGIDINEKSLERTREKLGFDVDNNSWSKIIRGDARKLNFLKDESIDLICTHPPYANIINYSEDIDGDLSLLKIEPFIEQMKKVASESFRVLKKEKFCAVLIGDTRKNGHVIPLGFKVMNTFLDEGFGLKEIIIKEQHNCSATGFWKTNSIKYNFLLLAHEYLFIFHKF